MNNKVELLSLKNLISFFYWSIQSSSIKIINVCVSSQDSFLVVDFNGLIEEYDSPTRLLENKSSSFAQLVAEYIVRANLNFGK